MCMHLKYAPVVAALVALLLSPAIDCQANAFQGGQHGPAEAKQRRAGSGARKKERKKLPSTPPGGAGQNGP